MTVKILLSQPAGGKTSCCIEKIREVRKRDPKAPVKVIVPDKMQMIYWKQTLSQKSRGSGGSGFIGTEIISFSKLAMEVLNQSEQSPQLIPSRLDSLCIREAIGNASEKQPFQYFAPISSKPGLLSFFEKAIRILQRGCVTPEELEEVTGNDPKVMDTARVYREYLDILKKNNWIGSAGLLITAADHLKNGHLGFPRCPLLIADGFDELTKDSLQFLSSLSPYCDEILITLPADPNSDDPTDKRILDNAEMIRKAMNAEYTYPKHYTENSEILRLAEQVFYPAELSAGIEDKKITVSSDNFLMIEASSRTTEVREALRELKKRIIESNKRPGAVIRPNECAVFVPDMNAYAPIFRQFGREMGIPLRFSQKVPLSKSPAASALKRLLHLYPDFDTMKVLSVLRLPFFSGCKDPKDPSGGDYSADLYVIDQVGRKMNIISGTEEWNSAFSKAMSSAAESRNKKNSDDEESDEGKVYEYPDPKKMKRILDSFLKFTEKVTPPAGVRSRSEWMNWLENLLDSIHFYEQIEDKKGKSFEADLKSLLKRIVFCENMLDRSAASYEEFLSELESEIDAAVQTEQEFAADRVFVGDIGQTSGCRWKLIILTGFSEGVFPRAEHEDLILSNELRKKLGLSRDMDQHLLFHHAVTRSDTGLVITRPQKTDKGEEWPASIFWQTIREKLGKDKNLLTVTENMDVTAASADELAFRLARSGYKDVPDEIAISDPSKLQEELHNAWNELERVRMQTGGEYDPGTYSSLKSSISDPVKDAVPYSCSVIETWLTCPFKYFLMKKLRLEQLQEPGTGMDAAQIGSLNHKVMELTFPPGTVYSSKEKALENANANIDKVFETAPREFGFIESELWEYEKEKYREKLLESIEKMFDAKKSKMPVNSRWTSVGAEMKFGYPDEGNGSTDPLTVETDAGPIRIRGIIDRVDQRDDGLLRVVDYKTGASGFGKEEIKAGSHIQAGVYAAAVVHALHMGTKCEGMYWSINNKSVKEYLIYDTEEDETIPNIEFLNRFTEGIRDAAFPAMPAGGTCPDYCPAAGWCRKFARREFYG